MSPQVSTARSKIQEQIAAANKQESPSKTWKTVCAQQGIRSYRVRNRVCRAHARGGQTHIALVCKAQVTATRHKKRWHRSTQPTPRIEKGRGFHHLTRVRGCVATQKPNSAPINTFTVKTKFAQPPPPPKRIEEWL